MPRNLCSVLAPLMVTFISLAGLAQAPPSADAYVASAQPTTNFGKSILLPVQGGTTSYVRLNLSAMPANAPVAKATLRLYVNAVAAPGSFDVYQLESGWTEKGVSFNSTPQLGASATGSRPVFVTSLSLNQFILIDITPLAQSWLNGSHPNYGVALALTSPSGSFSFDSKESTGTGHQPELDVVFGDVIVSPAASSVTSKATVTNSAPVISGLTDPYVDNGTALQVGANFNIGGSGTATSFNALQQYALAGTPVLGSNGTLSLFVGPGAGQSNSGLQNTFMGVSAGQANTTGNYNSFMGNFAGYSNTTGTLLTFLGMQSGYSNTTGVNNSFVGANSGLSNTTGSYNSFVGTGSGRANTTGSFLTFLGMQSGLFNTTGNYNSFMGTYSGYSNTTGSLLTFLGMQSGYSNTTGSNNIFVGTNSGLSNTIGSYNSFAGAGSGRANTTGSYLTFLGMQSGYSNTTGSFNNFLGNFAGFNNTTGNNNTFVGYNAGLNANPAANNNVYISSLGVSTDSGVIRIGDPIIQNAAYIAGIYGNAPSGALPVVVDANGQLGTTAAGIGVTTFNGRTGAVVPAANDYSFSQLSGSVSFNQVTGTVNNSQFAGAYTNPVALSNTGNAIAGAFTGTFTGDGSGLTGIGSGLNWPVVTKSADYSVQLSDFATPATRGNYVVLTGTVSRTFTLPNPPPPNGYCVAIGNVADAGINSGTNVFLTVSPNGLLMDNSVSTASMPRRTAYLYCSDGSASYYRLGYQQNGVNQIGPLIKTLDTGTVNAMTTTFRNGMDFGVVDGSMIFLLPKFANTSNIVNLTVNGVGPFRILRYGSQGLASGDLSPNAYALLIFNAAGSKWELLNPQGTQTLSGTTASIGGSLLMAGTCTTGTAAVNGATIGRPVAVSASDGSLPNGAIILSAAVTASNTVTVQLCSVVDMTPAAKTYNVTTQ